MNKVTEAFSKTLESTCEWIHFWNLQLNKKSFRMINFTKKITIRYFSSILSTSFRELALQNTFLYVCGKQVVHGLSKIIQIYVNIKINN